MKSPVPPRRGGGAPHPGSPKPRQVRRVTAVAAQSAAPVSADGGATQIGAAQVRAEQPRLDTPVVSTALQDRLAERDQAARKLRHLRMGIAGGIGLVLLFVLWLLFLSPVFAVQAERIEIQGLSDPTGLALVQAELQHEVGRPLTRVNTDAVEERLHTVPQVLEARVTREWARGLRVEIVPRQVVIAISTAQGFALLDESAVQVGTVAEVPANIPVVQAELESIDERTLTSALTVVNSLPPQLAAEVTSVQVENQDAIRLILVDATVVEWGSGEQSELKAAVLQVLRSDPLSNQGVKVYDVSAPGMPVTR